MEFIEINLRDSPGCLFSFTQKQKGSEPHGKRKIRILVIA